MKNKRQVSQKIIGEVLNEQKFDQAKLMSVYSGHVDDMNAHAPLVVAALGDFWDSLDSEQQAKIRAKMEKHFSRQGRWGHRHHH